MQERLSERGIERKQREGKSWKDKQKDKLNDKVRWKREE